MHTMVFLEPLVATHRQVKTLLVPGDLFSLALGIILSLMD